MVDVVAHRGDSLRYRENTLPALASAVEIGADRVEIDVRTTADDVSVLLHDRTLLRLWGLPVAVDELTWSAVAEIGYADQRVPRLREAADLVADTGVGLLVDATCARDAAAAWRELAAWRRDGGGALDVHWCGAREAMAAVRDLDPAAVIHLATDDGYADPHWSARLHPTYLNLDGTLLSPAAVAAAHEAGLSVSVWTIDDAWAMAAVAELGADSITTNRPALLRRTLAAPLPRAMKAAAPAYPEEVRADAERAAWVAAELGAWAAGYLRETLPGRIETKAHAADLVTEVDRAVERRVRDVLGAAFPGHRVVGEEEGGTSAKGVPTWYVDPVDGTTNFAHGLAWSSFSLALAVDRMPIVGVVADPWRGEVWSARLGAGARRDGLDWWAGDPDDVGGPDALSADEGPGRVDPLAGTVVLTEWAAHEPFPGQLDLLARLAERHCTVRVMGSGTLSVASVAAGSVAGCVIGDFHPEDHLAAVLIAREAGMATYDASGAVTLWPQGPFLVVAPWAARELLRVWLEINPPGPAAG